MNWLRRTILAASLLAAVLGPLAAIAQAPPPVPGLPDAERRTSYVIAGSHCACAVNFALYGDSTDVDAWLQVWINGIQYLSTDPSFGWFITSATGPIATIPRPITDAVLNFNQLQTGTIQIVGAQRPRRLTQYQENRGVAARDFNQIFNTVFAELREVWDKINDVTGRVLLGRPGNHYGPMPDPNICRNSFLGFDGTGLDPVCLNSATGIGPLGPSSSFFVSNDAYVCAQADGVNCAGAGTDVGLCATPATACRTVLYTTEQVMANYNGNGTQITVHVGTGNFLNDVAFIMGCPVGTSSGNNSNSCLTIKGNGSVNTLMDGGTQGAGGTIIANQSANLGVQNIKVQATGAGTINAIYANLGGTILISGGDVACGPAAAGSCMEAEQHSQIVVFGNMKITAGNYAAFANATIHSSIELGGATITITGTPTLTNFYNVADVSLIFAPSMTYTGAVHSGTAKYNIQTNSILDTQAACSSVPGIGTTVTTGGGCD